MQINQSKIICNIEIYHYNNTQNSISIYNIRCLTALIFMKFLEELWFIRRIWNPNNLLIVHTNKHLYDFFILTECGRRLFAFIKYEQGRR